MKGLFVFRPPPVGNSVIIATHNKEEGPAGEFLNWNSECFHCSPGMTKRDDRVFSSLAAVCEQENIEMSGGRVPWSLKVTQEAYLLECPCVLQAYLLLLPYWVSLSPQQRGQQLTAQASQCYPTPWLAQTLQPLLMVLPPSEHGGHPHPGGSLCLPLLPCSPSSIFCPCFWAKRLLHPHSCLLWNQDL